MVEILPRPCLWQCYGKRRRLSPRRQGEAFRPPAPRPALRRAGLLRRGLLEALFFSIFFSWSPTSSSWSFPERSASGGRSWWLATGAVGVSSAPGQQCLFTGETSSALYQLNSHLEKKKNSTVYTVLHCFLCVTLVCVTLVFFFSFLLDTFFFVSIIQYNTYTL